MSRFVSSGTSEAPSGSDEAWLAAQRAIEEKTIRKLNEGKQEGGKSLYEVLQANKEAKQEAFEESIKLKHQFRSLDEDDIEFLDSITQRERAKEAEARHETNVQLESFLALQEAAEKAGQPGELPADAAPIENWSTGPRKRKIGRVINGVVKKRQASVNANAVDELDAKVPTPKAAEPVVAQPAQDQTLSMPAAVNDTPTEAVAHKPEHVPSGKTSLGLGTYDSDDDDGNGDE